MENSSNVQKIYSNKPQIRAYLINPHWYVGIFSRGLGKSFLIQGIRSKCVAENVPEGLSCFYSATYVGAQQRTVAATISGWKMLGLKEGRDYVKNCEPPQGFTRNSYYKPITWSNTISFKNGHIFVIGSNDRPGLVNSLSITGGIFVDECRFIDEPLMREDLYPAIRGNNIWGENNPFVFSRTYTTDMPFIGEETDWIFDFEKLMIPDQIHLIAAASQKVEICKNEILQYSTEYNESNDYNIKLKCLTKIENLEARLKERVLMLNKIRSRFKDDKGSMHQGSTYFDSGSFISNINILKKNYFYDNFNPKKIIIAKTSFLNIRPTETEKKFYSQLAKKHFIHGNFDYSVIDQYGIADDNNQLQIKAYHILDYNPHLELDIEFDFGDMCGCSISQTVELEERYIATFDVILPMHIDDLVDIVNSFFEGHKNRHINVYKDPSGNWQRNKRGQTYGPQVIDRFASLGWTVVDMCPIGSINPDHDAKYQLLSMILKETYPGFPIIRIIHETNQALENSLKKAPLGVKINQNGTKTIYKDKSSERKIDLDEKSLKTTDHSDHFDVKMWHKYNILLPASGLF